MVDHQTGREPVVAITEAQPEDLETLVGFNLRMAQETEGKALSADRLRAGCRWLLEHSNAGRVFIARCAGQAAGSLGLTYEWSDWRNGTFWWIQSVYVLPEMRRKGVFRCLYQHILDLAQAHPDVCGVRLYVEKNNLAAQRTYATLGMTETDYRLYEVEFSRKDQLLTGK